MYQNIPKKFLGRFKKSRYYDNLEKNRVLPYIVIVLSSLFMVRNFFLSKYTQNSAFSVYILLFGVIAIFSIIFRLIIMIPKISSNSRLFNIIAGSYLILTLYSLAVISVIDSEIDNNLLAFAVGSIGYVFSYRTKIRVHVIVFSVSFIVMSIAYYLLYSKITSFDYLLNIITIITISLFIYISKEKNNITSFMLTINLERTNKKLKNQALKDPLTGLFNRRYMDDFIDIQVEIFKRNGTPFSLILADIDHFKSINDKYGHIEGDNVLTDFAKLIKNASRPSDILVRYGGEEFIIVATNTDFESAMILAERIRSAIEAAEFANKELKITSSFGVAQYIKGESEEELLKRTDKKLYQAKESGRNRTVG